MGACVLLVEDDFVVRDVLDEYLSGQGYEVIPASNGKQALDFLFSSDPKSPPDVVILDLMMPLITGWQVLQAIRSDRRLARLPVLVVTAFDKDRPSDVTGLLKKPFRLEELEEKLAACLSDGDGLAPARHLPPGGSSAA